MENKKGQGIFLGVVGVATLVVAIIGATFAYFSAQASNETAITGETAQGGQLSLAVAKIAPTGTYANGKLVPLNGEIGTGETAQDNPLQMASALGATNECVDSNNNVVCHVYSVTVTNSGTTALTVTGTLSLTSNAPAMKWKVISGAATDNASADIHAIGGTAPSLTPATGNIVERQSLTATGTADAEKVYYVVVWLEETNVSQDDTDANKTFTGTVTFNAVNADGSSSQGLTATFTA